MHAWLHDRLFNALLGEPLVGNAFRGTLVEAIVAEALASEWHWCADGWGSFDFVNADGLGLEVKQSAARQDWHDQDAKPCVCRFDIASRTGRWDGALWVAEPGRSAALYVFAHHPVFNPALADHRDPEQWEFYVVPATELPAQRSLGLNGIRSLASAVSFGGLAEAVATAKAGLP